MEVRPGYKQTEVGVIPEDWEVKPLAELARVRSGIAKNTNKAVESPVVVHYLRVANVQDGYLDLSEMSELRVSRDDVNRYALVPGDVLMNEGGDLDKLGRGAIWNGEFSPCVHQNHVFVVRCGSSLSPDYLNIWTGSAPARRYFLVAGKQTTNLASINKTALGQLPVALPRRAEQEAIAGALSDADALIESLEHLIAKKRHLKQGAMQDLLRPKSGWVTTKLGTLGAFIKGSGVKKDECQSGEIPCVRYGEIYTKHNDYIKVFHSWISRDVAATAKSLKAGDILFAGSGETKEEIGKCAALVNNMEAYAGGDIVILRPADSDSLFLGYYLNTAPVNRQKASRGQGDAVVHIGAAALADIDVSIPSKREQSSIATILSDMDAEIAELETKRAKAHQLKQSMIQELLTGRIRLA